jgi:hypothetical protein
MVHGLGLDESAVRAAEKIQFKPALKDGQPTDFESDAAHRISTHIIGHVHHSQNETNSRRLLQLACVIRSWRGVLCLASYARRATSSQIQLGLSRGDRAVDSPTVLCIDDRPQVLELRKATRESRIKKDGNECLLKYEDDGKMYLQFNQTITATAPTKCISLA